MTTTRPRRAKPADTPRVEPEDDIHPALTKLGGWDPERRAWVHGDPGKQALDLVNKAAAKRRAASEH